MTVCNSLSGYSSATLRGLEAILSDSKFAKRTNIEWLYLELTIQTILRQTGKTKKEQRLGIKILIAQQKRAKSKNHRATESFKLDNTLKITKSNHQPTLLTPFIHLKLLYLLIKDIIKSWNVARKQYEKPQHFPTLSNASVLSTC